MTKTAVQSGERLSFYQLFTYKKLSIEIPIIQRDYAQGRSSEKEVRQSFLKALYQYLEENKPNRDLDFVYGTTRVQEDQELFIPLDGQQRLTTLFLLHWYLSVLSGKKEAFKNALTQGGHSKFTYSVRSSSREFCDALMLKEFNYSRPGPGKSISERITNEGWYYLSWQYDPTVASMLEMLNAIEKTFGRRPDFYERLVDIDKPVITFQFLNLSEFNLTDDLYIKMNSRGKPLSPFENFKAKFEQRVTELFKDSTKTYSLYYDEKIVESKAAEYFSIKIDTEWQKYFWKASSYSPKEVDRYLMNFIRTVLSNQAAIINPDLDLEKLKILFKTQDANFGNHSKDLLSFYSLDELGAISKPTIDFLIRSFDKLSSISNKLKGATPDPFHFNLSEVQRSTFNHDLQFQDRIRLHAFLAFLVKYEDDISGLKDWMRVIYNLTENTRFDSAEELIRGLQEVDELLGSAPEIIDALAANRVDIGVFYGRQIEEEKIKACLIKKSADWAKLIKSSESHWFLAGQLGFLLEFSGISEYYAAHKHCDWHSSIDQVSFNKFQNYSKQCKAVFDYLRNRKDKEYYWERSVLTKGNYLSPASSNRLHFLTRGLKDRDHSWKRLLRLNRKEDEAIYKPRRESVKAILDDERFNSDDINGSCKLIIKDFPTDWRFYFIKEPRLIEVCLKGFIRFDDEETIMLLDTTRLTYHYELKSYYFFLTELQGHKLPPFEEPEYIREYGYEGHSHISFESWVYKKKEYQLNLYYDSEYSFGIEFSKVRGQKEKEDYDEDLQTILENLGFKFNNKIWVGYYHTAKSMSSAKKCILELSEMLNKL